jgi:hypothetical protein
MCPRSEQSSLERYQLDRPVIIVIIIIIIIITTEAMYWTVLPALDDR